MSVMRQLQKIIQDWSSLEDDYSKAVVRKEYRSFVHIIGLYPNFKRAEALWSCIRISVQLIMLLLHWCALIVASVVLYNINFIYFSSALHYVFVVGISFLYLLWFNMKRKFLSRFHSRIYLNFYDYHEATTEEINDLIRKTEKQKIRLMILPLFSAGAAASILLLAPILDKYGSFDFDVETSANFNLPMPMVYFFDTFTVVGYGVALLHQMFSAMLCALTIGGAGYMYMVMAISLITQLRILIHRLDSIESRAVSLFVARYGSKPSGTEYDMYRNKRFAECMNVCLRKCVEHHKIIIRNFDELNDFSSLPMYAIFFVGGLIIALAMLSSSFWKVLPGNTIASLVLCGTEVGYIGTLCSIGQTFIDLNEDARNAVYGIKWYNCNKGFCLNIRILLSKTIEPLAFTACGLIKICYDTYANIINTAYSYYNLVIATGN